MSYPEAGQPGGELSGTANGTGQLLNAPLDSASPTELLDHFRQPGRVRYMPVLDEKPVPQGQIDGILAHRFTLYGESHDLPPPMDWLNNPSADRQWHITLHKFYYGVEMGRLYHEQGCEACLPRWIELVESWIDQVPLDLLSCQVTGRRVQNWISAHYYFVTQPPAAAVDPAFYRRFLGSLHEQVSYLVANLSPARNHRTLELFAIFYAAVVFPEFRKSASWREFALAGLNENIRADLRPDGVQCEQSIDYHHLVLKNYLITRQLAFWNELTVPAGFDERIQSALTFAMHAHRPDGLIPAVSDGDCRNFLGLLAIGHELYGAGELRYVATGGREGTPPGTRSRGFPDGGYWFLRSGWGQAEPYRDERYLLFDCGPLGDGDHGHFDLLSVEMAGFGHPLIVDPGRYTYHHDPSMDWRAWFRGTAAHNTVLVDERNQTRYEFSRGKHRVVGPEPEYELRRFNTSAGCDYLHGIARSHEYDAVHERKILFARPDYWVIIDVLRGEQDHQYDLMFHLDAAARGQVRTDTNETTHRLLAPHLLLAQPAEPEVDAAVTEGWVSRIYGEKLPAPVVRYRCLAREAIFVTVVFPFQTTSPRVTVSRLPVTEARGNPAELAAQAVRVIVAHDGREWVDDCLLADHRPEIAWRFGDHESNSDHALVRRPGRVA